ncbi:DUF6894 family protein [Rhizobium sp. YIM 134829]|uniref:DUF6894 family protein n=1 Tax=Rhizobium sp. YIM 134829 TaxID=3390453 RepID=UPI00397E015C
MPRYFFHVRNHGIVRSDPEGADFETLCHAHQDALRVAREILAEKILTGHIIDESRFEITSEYGEVVDIVPFKAAALLA